MGSPRNNEMTELEWLEQEQEKEMVELALERSMNDMGSSSSRTHDSFSRSHLDPAPGPLHNSMPALHHNATYSPGPPERIRPFPEQELVREVTQMHGRYESSSPKDPTGGSERIASMRSLNISSTSDSPRPSYGYTRQGSCREVEETTETVVDSPHQRHDRIRRSLLTPPSSAGSRSHPYGRISPSSSGPSPPLRSYKDRAIPSPQHNRASPREYRQSTRNDDPSNRGSPYQDLDHRPHSRDSYGDRSSQTPYAYSRGSSRDSTPDTPRTKARRAVLETARQHLSDTEVQLVEEALRLGRGHGGSLDRDSDCSVLNQQRRYPSSSQASQHSVGSSTHNSSQNSHTHRHYIPQYQNNNHMSEEERQQLEHALQASQMERQPPSQQHRPPSLSAQETMELLSRASAAQHLSQEELDEIERALRESSDHIPAATRPQCTPPPAAASQHRERFAQQRQKQKPRTIEPPRRSLSAESLALVRQEIERAAAAKTLSPEELAEIMAALETGHSRSPLLDENGDRHQPSTFPREDKPRRRHEDDPTGSPAHYQGRKTSGEHENRWLGEARETGLGNPSASRPQSNSQIPCFTDEDLRRHMMREEREETEHSVPGNMQQNKGSMAEQTHIEDEEVEDAALTSFTGVANYGDPASGSLRPATSNESLRPPIDQNRRRQRPQLSVALAALPYVRRAPQGSGQGNIDLEYSVSQFGESAETGGSEFFARQGSASVLSTDTENSRQQLQSPQSKSSETVQGIDLLPPPLGEYEEDADIVDVFTIDDDVSYVGQEAEGDSDVRNGQNMRLSPHTSPVVTSDELVSDASTAAKSYNSSPKELASRNKNDGKPRDNNRTKQSSPVTYEMSWVRTSRVRSPVAQSEGHLRDERPNNVDEMHPQINVGDHKYSRSRSDEQLLGRQAQRHENKSIIEKDIFGQGNLGVPLHVQLESHDLNAHRGLHSSMSSLGDSTLHSLHSFQFQHSRQDRFDPNLSALRERGHKQPNRLYESEYISYQQTHSSNNSSEREVHRQDTPERPDRASLIIDQDTFDEDLQRALKESIEMHNRSMPTLGSHGLDNPHRRRLSQEQTDEIRELGAGHGGLLSAPRLAERNESFRAHSAGHSTYTSDADFARALQEAKDEDELQSLLLARQLQEEDERRVRARRSHLSTQNPSSTTGTRSRGMRVGAFESSSPPRGRHPLEEEILAVDSTRRRRTGQAGAHRSSSLERIRHPLENTYSSIARTGSQQQGRERASMDESHSSMSRSAGGRAEQPIPSLEESDSSLMSRSATRRQDRMPEFLDESNSNMSGNQARSINRQVFGDESSPTESSPHSRASLRGISTSPIHDRAANAPEGRANFGNPWHVDGVQQMASDVSNKKSKSASSSPKSKDSTQRQKVLGSVARLGSKTVGSLMQTVKRSSIRVFGSTSNLNDESGSDDYEPNMFELLSVNARIQIDRAINNGVINQLNGVVRYGSEAIIFHADRGPESGGFDVAVKVFKRARGHESTQAGKTADLSQFQNISTSEQLEMWTMKEYRNLRRARRAGVPCPAPIFVKNNLLFMQFVGTDGRPFPQLGELELRRGHKRWKGMYKQIIDAVKR